jgi:dipeptidyl aminopeptidase/acylaminoacyl peptidase
MLHSTSPLKATALFLAVVISASAVRAEGQRPISPEDILNIRWATSLVLSPDATQVAYVVHEPADAADPRSSPTANLWIAATDKSSSPRLAARGHFDVRHPAWSPDGDRLAFLSQGAGEARSTQIWLLQDDGELPTCLTRAAKEVVDYRWSPDGTEIAFTTPEPGDDAHDPIEVDRRHGRNRLWVVRVSEATMQAVTKPDQHVIDMDWRPGTSEFAAIVAPTDDLDDIFERAKLVIVDRATGTTKKSLSEQVADREGLAWSPDGKTIAFLEFTPKHFAYRLALVDATGGPSRYPLSDYRGTPETSFSTIRWSSDSRHLLVPTFETTRCRLLSIDTTTGSIQRLAESVHNFWSYSASDDGRTIAIGAENAYSPPDVVVLNDGQEPVKLTELNPQLSAFGLGNVTDISWKNKRDGKTIFGVLITPADLVCGQPRAAVVQLHGGPQAMWWNGWLGTSLSWGQFLASHGYVVLLPNPRGSIGQGWEFSEAVFRDWGGADFEDVMDGVDSLVAEQIADPDRLGVGGWSYGGYLAASTTTQTDRFKAAIVGASWTDLNTLGLTTDFTAWFRRIMGVGALEGDADVLNRLSPLAHVDRCKTPTLVLHGENDARCPSYHGRAWYRGLKLRGVESEMIVYPREGHVLTERAHQIDLMQRVLAWYDNHL